MPIGKRRYYTKQEAIEEGKQSLNMVLLPNDIRRPNGREFRRLYNMMFDKNNTNYSGEDLCSSCRFKKVFDFEYGKLAVCQKSLAEVKNVGVCCEYERKVDNG